MADSNKKRPDKLPSAAETPESRNVPTALDSAHLFASSKEIWIEHNGELYRLQRTKADKLILTK